MQKEELTKNAIQKMEQLLTPLRVVVSTITSIQAEENKEVIEVYLDVLQEMDNQILIIIGEKHKQTIKEQIRAGSGDFAKIQEKCIRLGLV